MLRKTSAILGPFRVVYVSPHAMPQPCAPRWDLKLSKARLWDERIDAEAKAAWQIEDERHMSPEYNEFIGYPTRKMRPGAEGDKGSDYNFDKLLPHHSVYELQNRRDVPFQDNVLFGKQLFDETMYGMSTPYCYSLFKSMQKANRNDRKIKQNKFRIVSLSGSRNPPSGFTPIPDPSDEEEK